VNRKIRVVSWRHETRREEKYKRKEKEKEKNVLPEEENI
jgi:hypothetical protein